MRTPSSHAIALVDELAATAALVGTRAALDRRTALLSYISDLETDLSGEVTGPFTALRRTDGCVDVVRVGDVGTETEQPRHLIAEAVSPASGEVAVNVLNALAACGIIPGRSTTKFAFDFWPPAPAAEAGR